MTVSRLESLVVAARGTLERVDGPGNLPPAVSVDLLLVDWSERDPGWGPQITAWRNGAVPAPRIILFGPHTDLDAHAAAREAGLGPMKARSALMAGLSDEVRRLPERTG
jgi:hypothetical protein